MLKCDQGDMASMENTLLWKNVYRHLLSSVVVSWRFSFLY
jgi:hypothetical protein